jgi:hypothetical protein
MKSKKENLTDLLLFNPVNKPEEIVIPDLETPGNKARTCINPISKVFFQFNFEYSRENLVRKIIIEENRKVKPRKRKDVRDFSIISLNNNPNTAAGNVAKIK